MKFFGILLEITASWRLKIDWNDFFLEKFGAGVVGQVVTQN